MYMCICIYTYIDIYMHITYWSNCLPNVLLDGPKKRVVSKWMIGHSFKCGLRDSAFVDI